MDGRRPADRNPLPLRQRAGRRRGVGFLVLRRHERPQMEQDRSPLLLGAAGLRRLHLRSLLHLRTRLRKGLGRLPRARLHRRVRHLPAQFRGAPFLEREAGAHRLRRRDDGYRGQGQRCQRGRRAPRRILPFLLRYQQVAQIRTHEPAGGDGAQAVGRRVGQRRRAPGGLVALRRHLPARVPGGAPEVPHRPGGRRCACRRDPAHGPALRRPLGLRAARTEPGGTPLRQAGRHADLPAGRP